MPSPAPLRGTQIFGVEFASPADLQWFSTGFEWGGRSLPSNGEKEYYGEYGPEGPFQVHDGVLTITATPNGSSTLPYTSGLLDTYATFQMQYGYVELGAKLPTTDGFWPAFWAVPAYGAWPEADIMERNNRSEAPGQYWTHTQGPGLNTGGWVDTGESTDFGQEHRYGMQISAPTPSRSETLQYFFDDKPIGPTVELPQDMNGIEWSFRVNLAVGGWANVPAPGASASMDIDFIRAWSPPEADSPLTLAFSQDKFGPEDAEINVWIDGRNYGPLVIHNSDYSTPEWHSFDVAGWATPGHHSVGIELLNDAGEAPGGLGHDRNAFLQGGFFGGIFHSETWVNQYSNGRTDAGLDLS